MVLHAPNMADAKPIIKNEVYSIFDLEIKDDKKNILATASKTILNPRELTRGHKHDNQDEWYYFKSGEGEIFLGEDSYEVTVDSTIFVPKGVKHRIFNTARTLPLEFYTFFTGASERPSFSKITYKKD